MSKKQKDIFLEFEGDIYFERNNLTIQNQEIGPNDPIIFALSKLIAKKNENNSLKLLEVGCGEAKRLQWISQNYNIQCFGVDPSKKAVETANLNNVSAVKGTADNLKYENEKFDFVVFGFCLYLCDREDLFQIAKETDRVLKKSGYIIIRDFFSTTHFSTIYKHNNNLLTYKMDYRKLFDWHPHYECIFHTVDTASKPVPKDDKSEWRATSIIRKNILND
jgi:ubiquinone/menaquinone biosynthesis C-methylase UbiE